MCVFCFNHFCFNHITFNTTQIELRRVQAEVIFFLATPTVGRGRARALYRPDESTVCKPRVSFDRDDNISEPHMPMLSTPLPMMLLSHSIYATI